MEDKESHIARDITVAGSGGATIAGLTTTVVGITTAALGVTIVPVAGALIGLGSFAVGALGSYWLRDKLLDEAGKVVGSYMDDRGREHRKL